MRIHEEHCRPQDPPQNRFCQVAAGEDCDDGDIRLGARQSDDLDCDGFSDTKEETSMIQCQNSTCYDSDSRVCRIPEEGTCQVCDGNLLDKNDSDNDGSCTDQDCDDNNSMLGDQTSDGCLGEKLEETRKRRNNLLNNRNVLTASNNPILFPLLLAGAGVAALVTLVGGYRTSSKIHQL